MVRPAKFFKSNLRLILVLGVLCVVLLVGVRLISGSRNSLPVSASTYDAQTLLKYKTAYVGDNSKVVNLINDLPYANLRREVSLQTDNTPYGITVNYDFSAANLGKQQIEWTFRDNAVVMFALIDNVDVINFNVSVTNDQLKYRYSRADVQKSFHRDLREYSKDTGEFDAFLKGLTMSIDEAVSLTIKDENTKYGEGETTTEGHIILGTREDNGNVKAYTIASFGAFGFENGIFTKVSGSGAIPTVMIFSKNENGEYSLLEYKVPEDGAGYVDSIKKMFPKELWDKVLSADKYPELIRQQEEQAEKYLQSIGRNAKVSAAHVDKKLADIDVQASNKLFAEYTKFNAFLNSCPYWLGTRERVENGVRYIYETSQVKAGDGYDLIIFRKTKEDGTVVEEYKYKIVGSDPQLIEKTVQS
ncbi:MAG: DUF4825 domain-containing protein [Bacillota bacterium]